MSTAIRPKPDPSAEGLNVAEVARDLGISKSRVYRLIQKGRLDLLAAGQPRGERGRFCSGGIVVDRRSVDRFKEERDGLS